MNRVQHIDPDTYFQKVNTHFKADALISIYPRSAKIDDPKCDEVSVKYFLCDVLSHHIGRIGSSRNLNFLVETTPEATSSWMNQNP